MNKDKKNKFIEQFINVKNNNILWSILFGVTLIFIIFLNPVLIISNYSYKLGDIAKRDIKASTEFHIENFEVTNKNKENAIKSVLTIYDYDEPLLNNLVSRLNDTFNELHEVYEPPKHKEKYDTKEIKPTENKVVKPKPPEKKLTPHEKVWEMKPNFEEKIGISVSQKAYTTLERDRFSNKVPAYVEKILSKILTNGIASNKEHLLKESENGITLLTVGKKTEQVVFNIKHVYSLKQAQKMVKIEAETIFKNTNLNYNLRDIISDFVERLIRPNITLNRSETEARKKASEEAVKPTLYKIKRDEILIRKGERVTKRHLRILNSLESELQKEDIYKRGIGTAFVIIIFLLTSYFLYFRDEETIEINHNKNILFLASVLVTFLFLAKISIPIADAIASSITIPINSSSMIYGIPIAAGTMTICLFIGVETAIPFALIMSIFTAIIFTNRFEIFIYFLLSSTMATYWMKDCSERKVFIKASVQLGIFNAGLVIAIDIFISDFYSIKLLWDGLFAFMGGITAGILTAGIAPFVEMIFDFTTEIKLLELANLDQPILRRLLIEAPGTYNHSVIVGTMADSVASEIGANPLLARVCGYYHDIGKIKKPPYFIENQSSNRNKHDKLAPSLSALVIIAHVKDGVEIAKENKLGIAIIDTIKQHHGTTMLSYFYEKAKNNQGDKKINPEDFRYPGPKPQTREAGIVMIADVVEAASRTLENPTPSRIQGLVQNLINKIFADGQLDYCELTLKDLHRMAKTFHQILSGIYHHRIEYPDNISNGKEKNGNIDKQQYSKESDNIKQDDLSKSTSPLKRLGLS